MLKVIHTGIGFGSGTETRVVLLVCQFSVQDRNTNETLPTKPHPQGPTHLYSIPVLCPSDVALKHVEHIFLLLQLLSPHHPQPFGLPATPQIKQVIILQLTECWTRRIPPPPVWKVVPFQGPMDVAFRSGGPENGSYILATSSMVGWLFPW